MRIKSYFNHIKNKKYLNQLLEDRNISLWRTLQKTENIFIMVGKYDSYGVYSVNKKHTIYIQQDNLHSASFTHELLHIYLFQQNVYVGGILTLEAYSDINLQKIFSNELLDHITNSLNHLKMLPIFLDLGYNVDEFISDYNVDKSNNPNFDLIKQYFTFNHSGKKVYLDKAIDCYIGCYFAAKSCPNKTFDYTELYKDLKTIDENLIAILDIFVHEWSEYDYEDKSSSYRTSVINFMKNMKEWCGNKQIYYTNA